MFALIGKNGYTKIMKNRKPNTKITAVEESIYGTYVWYTDDRKMLKDDEGRFLCVASKKGDQRILDAFKKAAHGYMKDMGAEPNGRPMFLSGHRPITDEQYEEQKAREAM